MPTVLKLLAPGTLAFFIVVAGLCAALVWSRGRARTTGIAVTIALTAVYFAMALPRTAALLSAGLIRYGPLTDARDAQGAAAIVVLTGDSHGARVVEAARLYALLQPQWLLMGGTELMREELIKAGVPKTRILMEGGGRTTREQIVNVERIVRRHNMGRVVLVVSAIHMRRTLAAARAVGLDAVPSASPTRRNAGPPFVPTFDGLRLTRESLYEYAALAYYEWRGWLKAY
jgi:uncharacterized SAM-binding protein YcdF (DUF218 family)